MKSLGEYRVGVDFNPSSSELVQRIKADAARLIDTIALMQEDRVHSADSDVEQSQHIEEIIETSERAMREVESAAMWAVKAATKKARL